ncbi:MAG TPA: serine/threonine-protein kinase [Polyangiaceae bacterium]|nr:serine/threonine-protein kinase [Polyangiaceae bacterium]
MKPLLPNPCGATAVGLLTIEPPERFGKFDLHFLVSRGGTGEVFLAENTQTLETCAIKRARLDVPCAVEVIRAEGETLRLLRADGIVSVFESGEASGRPYIVMEYMAGGNLQGRREQFAESRRALGLLLTIARAVQRAHDRLIVHCDLKPENILFRSLGGDEAKVSDFGLGQRVVGGDRCKRAKGGTIGWMSPEQADGHEVTIASDVFSLGVLLYWLLAGAEPFGVGPDFEAYRQRLRDEEPPPPIPKHWFARRLDREVTAICQLAMAKSVSHRYRSVGAPLMTSTAPWQTSPFRAKGRCSGSPSGFTGTLSC